MLINRQESKQYWKWNNDDGNEMSEIDQKHFMINSISDSAAANASAAQYALNNSTYSATCFSVYTN